MQPLLWEEPLLTYCQQCMYSKLLSYYSLFLVSPLTYLPWACIYSIYLIVVRTAVLKMSSFNIMLKLSTEYTSVSGFVVCIG